MTEDEIGNSRNRPRQGYVGEKERKRKEFKESEELPEFRSL
jgi:hypothetical protein